MEKKANNTTNEKEHAEAIEKALRSNGFLFPQTDDEIESMNEIIGSTTTPLPDSLKDTSFLFEKKEPKVIPFTAAAEPADQYMQAYAARDGQDSISPETAAKMDSDVKKLKASKPKKNNKNKRK